MAQITVRKEQPPKVHHVTVDLDAVRRSPHKVFGEAPVEVLVGVRLDFRYPVDRRAVASLHLTPEEAIALRDKLIIETA